METENKRNNEDMQLDLDTDAIERKGFAGIERDKRGELAILLPVSDRTISRLRGFAIPSPDISRDDPASHARVEPEKGSRFTGTLQDSEGTISLADIDLKEQAPREEAGEEKKLPPPDSYGATEILVPDRPPAEGKPGMMDFDLDFSPSKTKVESPKSRPRHAWDETGQKRGKTEVRPAWMPPEEAKPPPPPVKKPKPEKKAIPFDEPEIPDKAPAPIIIKGPAKEKKADEDKPKMPPIQAHSYLDGESVLEASSLGAPAKPGPKTKKKMKLPKRIKEKKVNLSLVLLMILLFLILGCILSVQYVPEARQYYDKIRVEYLGFSKSRARKTDTIQVTKEYTYLQVGQEKVPLTKGTDMEACKSYVNDIRDCYSAGNSSLSRKER